MTTDVPGPAAEPEVADVADALVDLLAQTAFATVAEVTRLGTEHDLSLTQLRVLAILRDRRARIGALAHHLGLEKSTLSGLVDRAEHRGLVVRAPDPADRRVAQVALTAEGQELARRLERALADRLRPSLAGLTAAEQEQLGVLLARIVPDADLRST